MPKYSNGRHWVGVKECEKNEESVSLSLGHFNAMVGSMFAQAALDHIPGPNPEAPGQIAQETGVKPGAADGHSGAPGQTGENPGNGNEPKGVGE